MKRTVKNLQRFDHTFIKMIVEKLHVAAFKPNEMILKEDEKADDLIIVLEGQLCKVRDGRMVWFYECN